MFKTKAEALAWLAARNLTYRIDKANKKIIISRPDGRWVDTIGLSPAEVLEWAATQ